jgi:hypothetical protein
LGPPRIPGFDRDARGLEKGSRGTPKTVPIRVWR